VISEQDLQQWQRKSLRYFTDLANFENGLVPDSSEENSPCTIAGVGFALTGYCIGAERGFLPKLEAETRVLNTLKFLAEAEHGVGLEATGHKGFFYHFLDLKSGKRTWSCELSFIDSGFLFAGITCAAQYFHANAEIQEWANLIHERVEWKWAMNGKSGLSQGWYPDAGFIDYEWEGYSEALLLYAQGLGAKHALPKEAYSAWTSTYQWESVYDKTLLYAGPFFIHLFSHAWIDFRGIQDKFMTDKKSDYFENTRHAVEVQRFYCQLNPNDFHAYGKDSWGLTACAGPDYGMRTAHGERHRYFGYAARGVPFGPDDGTLAPWVPLASIPFAPEAAALAVERMTAENPHLVGKYGFHCSFNATIKPRWQPARFYAIDCGIVLLMIENHRSGLVWDLMKGCPRIRRGLTRAGFKGGWLGGSA
jgi:hypothetical protein